MPARRLARWLGVLLLLAGCRAAPGRGAESPSPLARATAPPAREPPPSLSALRWKFYPGWAEPLALLPAEGYRHLQHYSFDQADGFDITLSVSGTAALWVARYQTAALSDGWQLISQHPDGFLAWQAGAYDPTSTTYLSVTLAASAPATSALLVRRWRIPERDDGSPATPFARPPTMSYAPPPWVTAFVPPADARLLQTLFFATNESYEWNFITALDPPAITRRFESSLEAAGWTIERVGPDFNDYRRPDPTNPSFVVRAYVEATATAEGPTFVELRQQRFPKN